MIVKNEFETKITGSQICQIDDFTDVEKLGVELNKCPHHIITKVDTTNTEQVNFLLKNGFFYSAINLSLESMIEDRLEVDGDNIRELNDRDKEELFIICDESFTSHNRYANDIYLKDFNKDIHRQWLENSINGYADYCCGYIADGKLMGLGTLHINNEYASIGLLAVARKYRNQGIGSIIIYHLKNKTLAEGTKRIVVVTEADNYSALTLYVKKGFSFYNSKISLYRRAK